MLGEGVWDEVIVVVTVGLDCAVTTNQLFTRFTVDLDRLCRMLGAQRGHLLRSHHL